MKTALKSCLIFFVFLHPGVGAQNTYKKWFFGVKAGLDFMTTPPTVLTTGALSAHEGCSSMSDAAGNLLFYMNPTTIWNQLHVPMANGTGLLGDTSATQGALIIQDPGIATQYYVFTLDALTGVKGLRYSKVDMTLAAGMGSVTTKNVMLLPQSSEKMTAVRHCNGVDVWLITHDWGNNNFRLFLITATGINPTPVVSSIGPPMAGSITNCGGQLKVSPNGKKLASAMGQSFQLYDLNTCTGTVCNSFTFGPTFAGYGCEFSPDGTRLYGATLFINGIFQWDLCAGSNAAIAASQFSIATQQMICGLQRGPDNKIYVARYSQLELGVINNPNALGMACNFVEQGQLLGPHLSQFSMPYRMAEPVPDPPQPFTFNINNGASCYEVAFQLPVSCPGVNQMVTDVKWQFGDPASGQANSSTLTNPVHLFSANGTYIVDLILNYSCSSDTLSQAVTVSSTQSLSVVGSPATCSGLGSATAAVQGGTGPYSYTWSPSGQHGVAASGLSAGIHTVIASDGNCAMVTTVSIGLLNTLTGTVTPMSIPCPNGGATGGASVSLSGGAGPFTYSWSSGAQTTPMITGLAPGTYSVLVTMGASACTFTQTFQVNPQSGTVTSLPPVSACVNQQVSLSTTVSGTSYLWTGPRSFSTTAPQVYIPGAPLDASGVYTLQVTDHNHCSVTSTVSLMVYAAPKVELSSSTSGECVPFCSTFKGKVTDNGIPVISSAIYIGEKGYNAMEHTQCFTDPGNYKISIQAVNIYSCSAFMALQINAYAKPKAGFDFLPVAPVENEEDVFFMNTSTGEQQKEWSWHFINNSGGRSDEQNPSYLFKAAGVYPVAMVVTNTWGCSDTLVRQIEVLPDFSVYIPNAFTPDGDGRNDAFYAKGTGIKTYSLVVFDRWGEKLFSTTDAKVTWDGSYKGRECKNDTYVWKLRVSGINGKVKEMAGQVLLLR